jgi:hypothetical protein
MNSLHNVDLDDALETLYKTTVAHGRLPRHAGNLRAIRP